VLISLFLPFAHGRMKKSLNHQVLTAVVCSCAGMWAPVRSGLYVVTQE